MSNRFLSLPSRCVRMPVLLKAGCVPSFHPFAHCHRRLFRIWPHPNPFLKVPLLQTRAPISGLSSTVTCNSQSPPFPSFTSNNWIMEGKYPWGPGGGILRTLWTDPGETSNPEGLKDWHRERPAGGCFWVKKIKIRDRKGEIKMTNEADPLQQFLNLLS